MKELRDEIQRICKKVTKERISIEYPPRPEFGDYAVPCFKLGANPMKIAKDIASAAESSKFIERTELKGPYVNFFVNKEKRAEMVFSVLFNDPENFGSQPVRDEKVMIEFSQPNTHKAFHVGHLRNACLGDALVKLFRRVGYPTIAANYINDTGTHVAKCLWAYIKFFKGKEPFVEKGEWLGMVYAKASKELKEHPEWMDEVYAIHQKIEKNDPQMITLWEMTREWCMDDFLEIYKELNIIFDTWFFDNELIEPGKEIVQELIAKGVAKEDAGAIIVDLSEFGLAIALILKSDGTSLYITKDLALAKEKFEQHKIDRNIYIVASEQNMHFKQLFKVLELWGFSQAKNCFHLPYELVMDVSGQKLSSREGTALTHRMLMNDVRAVAKEEVEERHPEWGDKRVEEVAQAITIASIKFTMIHHDNNKTIQFDPKQACRFDGETGPYCQYAYARACSVLKKAGVKKRPSIDYNIYQHAKEQALISIIGHFPATIQRAVDMYAPSVIAEYTLHLAQTFTDFYESCPILLEKDNVKDARLVLLDAARLTLKNALQLLGIPVMESM